MWFVALRTFFVLCYGFSALFILLKSMNFVVLAKTSRFVVLISSCYFSLSLISSSSDDYFINAFFANLLQH